MRMNGRHWRVGAVLVVVGCVWLAGCSGEAPPEGDLGPWTGAVGSTGAVVMARVESLDTVRLLIRAEGGGEHAWQDAGAVRAVDQADRVVRFEVSGLEPDRGYELALTGGTAAEAVLRGRFRTFPSEGAPARFRFTFASCQRTGSDHAVHDAIAREKPLFHLITGDFHYEDIDRPDASLFAAAYARNFGSASQSRLYAQVPLVYIWDDHDFTGNNSHGGSAARSTVRELYRRWIPHYPLAAGGPDASIQQAFTVGRVRFLLTDLRSERDPHRTDDHPGKTMLGAAQKQWLQEELRAAAGRYGLVVWVSSVPWIAAASPRADHWGGFAHERAEVAAMLSGAGLPPVLILSGDSHMLAADDGSNSRYGPAGSRAIPVFAAAPLDKGASDKGGTYSAGKYLVRRGEGAYGLMEIEDDGRAIVVRFRGRTHTGETRISLEHRFEP